MRVTYLALCLASPAFAECPVAEDLEKGIKFTISGDETEVFRKLPNGLITSDYGGGGYYSRVLLAKGVYLLEVLELENGDVIPGTRVTYAFPVRHEELPDPVPGTGWRAELVLNEGGAFSKETQVYSFGAPQTIRFGGCAYELIPVTVDYPGENQQDTLHYMPALGISYLAAYKDAEETNRFEYQAIEAVK